MTVFRTQYALPLTSHDEEINVDLFAGGGGASTGLEMGLGRPVHIAVNHNPAAISMHEANHPGTLHLQTDVWEVDPVQALAGRRLGWFHASPDCTHHSQAAGGQPRKKEIRDLSWVVPKWAGKGQKPYRTAAECIDWSIPAQSIFERKRPLADATLRRIARGIQREVIDRAQPFIVPIANWSREAVHPVDQPLNTVTAWPRGGAFALASPVMVSASHGEGRPGGVQRWGCGSKPVVEPLGTVTAGGSGGHSVATAFLAQANGGFNTTHSKGMDEPMTTVTNTGSQQQLVTANLVHMRGNCDARAVDEALHTISAGDQHHALATAFLSRQFGASVGAAVDHPAPTITAGGGGKSALVELTLSPEEREGALRCAAFMINYYGNGDARSLEQPLDTITTRDRLALVTVWIGGDPYVIVDICLRMLQPHELYAAQGFPSNYIIDRGHDGRRFTKSEQVHMCGNSVSPPAMAAIAAANNPWRIDELEQREAA